MKGDKVTDKSFEYAIKLVSSDFQVKWTAECLYYEVCKRIRKPKNILVKLSWSAMILILFSYFFWSSNLPHLIPIVVLVSIIPLIFKGSRFAPLEKRAFYLLLERWQQINGVPKGIIKKRMWREVRLG
jgi:hypothetical protein